MTFIYEVADTVLMILMYAIIIRALLSWFPNLPNNAFFKILYDITDPILKLFQRFRIGGSSFAVDLSPLLAYFAIMIIRGTILPMLFRFLIF